MESENKPKARGRWVKGQSGNPGGRPRKPEVVSAFLEAIVKDANGNTINRREEIMAALYTVATTRGSKEQIKAAELLLAYDLGKPTERHEISGPDGGPLASVDMTAGGDPEEAAGRR